MDGTIREIPGISGVIGCGGTGYVPTYEGETTVTPKLGTETILQTKGKRMTENITVTEIPIAAVSNAADGKTITIGGIKNG